MSKISSDVIREGIQGECVRPAPLVQAGGCCRSRRRHAVAFEGAAPPKRRQWAAGLAAVASHAPARPPLRAAAILEGSRTKQRKFQETIELQIGLKNYDPQKDKRFSGTVKLPYIPRPNMKVCVLGDVKHCEQVRAHGGRGAGASSTNIARCLGHAWPICCESRAPHSGRCRDTKPCPLPMRPMAS